MRWARPRAKLDRQYYQGMKGADRMTTASCSIKSLGRAAKLGRGLDLSRLGPDRLDLAALDCWRLHPRSNFRVRRRNRSGLLRVMRMRTGHRACHQHLGAAGVMEVAIGEAHAGDRAAEAGFVGLVQIEAGLEWQPPQRGANGLSANLQRIAGQADMPDGPGARELHGTGGAHVIEDTSGTAGAVEAGECEDLAGDELARLLGGHRPCERGCDHGAGGNGAQQKTRKHAATPN